MALSKCSCKQCTTPFSINSHLRQHLLVEPCRDGFYLVWPDGEKYSGPYKRAQDARAQLTMITKDK
jgi:hypothetical protein